MLPEEMSSSAGGKAAAVTYGVSVYDVMRGYKMNWRQIAILAYGALSYSQFINHIMLVTMSQASLWELWPELADHRLRYNSVIAGQAFARLLGNLYLLPLQDYYGRRNLFMLCNVLPLLATVGSGFAGSFATYAVFRCIAVFIASAAGIGANIYVIELVNPRLRGTANWLNMVVSCLGIMYLIACKYLLERAGWSVWNWLQFFGFLPAAVGVAIGCVLFLESPGFQILYREEGAVKAWKTIERVAGGPEEVDRIIAELRSDASAAQTPRFSPGSPDAQTCAATPEPLSPGLTVHAPKATRRLAIRGEAEIAERGGEIAELVYFLEEADGTSGARHGLWTFLDIRPVIRSWVQLFKRPATRADTIALSVIWFGEAFCHWGVMSYCTLFYQTMGFDANLMNIIAYCAQLPLHFLIMHISERVRNEALVIGTTTSVAAVLSLVLAVLMGSRAAGHTSTASDWSAAVLAVLVAVNGCIVWGPVYAFTAERYPISVRASAMGLMSGVNAISLVAASYLSSVVITPTRIQYMLYVSTGLRTIVAVVTLTMITTKVAARIFDFHK